MQSIFWWQDDLDAHLVGWSEVALEKSAWKVIGEALTSSGTITAIKKIIAIVTIYGVKVQTKNITQSKPIVSWIRHHSFGHPPIFLTTILREAMQRLGGKYYLFCSSENQANLILMILVTNYCISRRKIH